MSTHLFRTNHKEPPAATRRIRRGQAALPRTYTHHTRHHTQSSTMGDATQVDLPGAGQPSRPLGTGMRPCHALAQLCSHVCSHTFVKRAVAAAE